MFACLSCIYLLKHWCIDSLYAFWIRNIALGLKLSDHQTIKKLMSANCKSPARSGVIQRHSILQNGLLMGEKIGCFEIKLMEYSTLVSKVYLSLKVSKESTPKLSRKLYLSFAIYTTISPRSYNSSGLQTPIQKFSSHCTCTSTKLCSFYQAWTTQLEGWGDLSPSPNNLLEIIFDFSEIISLGPNIAADS